MKFLFYKFFISFVRLYLICRCFFTSLFMCRYRSVYSICISRRMDITLLLFNWNWMATIHLACEILWDTIWLLIVYATDHIHTGIHTYIHTGNGEISHLPISVIANGWRGFCVSFHWWPVIAVWRESVVCQAGQFPCVVFNGDFYEFYVSINCGKSKINHGNGRSCDGSLWHLRGGSRFW